ncbi:MAG: hypothetical protein O7G87_19370, partial [bacterium]|nr:hypothetical protein [bacterium]
DRRGPQIPADLHPKEEAATVCVTASVFPDFLFCVCFVPDGAHFSDEFFIGGGRFHDGREFFR